MFLWKKDFSGIQTKLVGLVDSFWFRALGDAFVGIGRNSLGIRAAGLGYSSVLALGPLVFLMVWISSFFYENDQAVSQGLLSKVLAFIAPQIGQMQGTSSFGNAFSASLIDPQLVELLHQILESTKSQAFGVTGACLLLGLIIQLFLSVEESLNRIWESSFSHPWLDHLLRHILVLFVGCVLGFLGVVLFVLSSTLPFFAFWFENAKSALPFLFPVLMPIFVFLILLIFYKFVPNKHVNWRCASFGAIWATVGLYLNNFFAFLYIRKFVIENNFYGSLGIFPVLLMSLYIFLVNYSRRCSIGKILPEHRRERKIKMSGDSELIIFGFIFSDIFLKHSANLPNALSQ